MHFTDCLLGSLTKKSSSHHENPQHLCEKSTKDRLKVSKEEDKVPSELPEEDGGERGEGPEMAGIFSKSTLLDEIR